MTRDRAVVAGLGVISALGPDRDAFTDALREGRSGVRELTLFDTDGFRSPLAAQAPTPQLSPDLGPQENCSRADLLALHAAAEAIQDAGLSTKDLAGCAVVVGTGAGGIQHTEAYQRALAHGEDRAPPRWLVPHQPANATDLVANRLGIGGPRCSLMTACSSSASALGVGLDMIRLGRASRVLAGGTEALCGLTFGGFSSLRAMDHGPCRPFHRQRNGLTLGDGAAFLVLEAPDLAANRDVTIYADLAGYGISSDAHHLTAPAPDGRGARASMAAALEDAGLEPSRVQYINAHGTATRHNDPIEVAAIRGVFGSHAESLAVSSTKAATGHTLGAAGAMEAAVCCVALRHGFIPPTLRLDDPDPQCDLDLVPHEARKLEVEVALSNSFAFGGNNTSLVLTRTRCHR